MPIRRENFPWAIFWANFYLLLAIFCAYIFLGDFEENLGDFFKSSGHTGSVVVSKTNKVSFASSRKNLSQIFHAQSFNQKKVILFSRMSAAI